MRRRRILVLGGALLLLAIATLTLRSNSVAANPLGGITAVSAGEGHTCAITGAGGVKCWGEDTLGQLGDGRFDDPYDDTFGLVGSATPVDVLGLPSGIVALAAGFTHTCALTDAGAVLCWGGNGNGQLGSNTGEPPRGPRPVAGISDAIALAAGGDHNCVVRAGGAVDCWGDGWYGQLGNGSIQGATAPVEVQGISNGAIGVAMSERHTCAVMASGGVKCWGDNQFGELGDGTAVDRLTPADVVGLTDATAVAAGNTFTCALASAGGIKCWGDRYGNFPADVAGLTSGVAAVSSAYAHTCALLDSGSVKCWGTNSSGQLGDGRRCGMTACVQPVDVSGLTGVTAISAGAFHTCAVLDTGGAKCWGNNYLGQLGNGESGYGVISTTPVDVVENTAKPRPTPQPCLHDCPTPTPSPTVPRTGLDFSIAIDANGDGIDDCTTHEEHRSDCRLAPGSAFAVRVDVNALPAEMPSYQGFDVRLVFAGVESTHKSIALWPDCGYPASLHEPGRALFGCAAPINGSSTFVGPLGESHFTCAGNGSVTLVHGDNKTQLFDGSNSRIEAEGTTEVLAVTCGDLVRGDVDCNVIVDGVDASLMLQREAAIVDALGCPQQADVNLDNRTNAIDAAITLQYTAGLVDALPPQAAGLR